MACVNETCSIAPTIDALDGSLSLNVKIDANGCLECAEPNGLTINIDPDGCLKCTNPAGLGVKVHPSGALGCDVNGLSVRLYNAVTNTVAGLGDCYLPVGYLTDDNSLYVQPPTTIAYEAQPSTQRSIPTAGGSTANPSIRYTYTNNSSCDELVEVHAGEVKVIFEVNDAAEYYLTGALLMQLSTADIGGNSTIVGRTDYAGDSAAANTELQYSHHLLTHVLVPGGGGALTVRINMSVGTRSGNIVGAAGGGVGGNTGFRSLKNYIVVHKLGSVGADLPGNSNPN